MALISFFSPALKLFDWIKKKMGRKYGGYMALKDLGISPEKADFNGLYYAAIDEYDKKYIKHPLLVKLFTEETAKASFKKDFQEGTSDKLKADINANLHAKDIYADLRDANITLESEIELFVKIFARKINEAASPLEHVMLSEVKEIRQSLAALNGIAKDAMDLSEYIDGLNRLRSENKHASVISQLDDFKTKRWAGLSNELRYRVDLNYAVTYFDLGQKEKAVTYLIKLLDYGIRLEETFGYVALGFAMIGDNENGVKYASKAIALNDKNVNAYLALLFCNEETLKVEELDNLIPPEIQKEPVIAVNIGKYLEATGDLEGAFAIFSDLENHYEKKDSLKYDLLTQLAINRITSIDHTTDYIFQLSDGDRQKLLYGVGKLSEAWEYVKDTDLRKGRYYILANRGVAYKILGEKEKAISDFEDSLQLEKNFIAYIHLLQLNSNDPTKISQILKEADVIKLSEHENQELLLYKVALKLDEGHTSESLVELEQKLPQVEIPDLKRNFMEIIKDIFLMQDDYPSAEDMMMKCVSEFPDAPQTYVALARFYHRKGDIPMTMNALQNGKALIKQKGHHFVAIQLADLFAALDDLNTAIELLEQVAVKNIFTPVTLNLLKLYFRADNYKAVEELSGELLPKNPDAPELTDILSSVYESSNKFDKAINVLKDYLNLKPEDHFMRAKLAINYYKNGDYVNGAAAVDQIEDFSELPLDAGFFLASIYIQNRQIEKGLALGYVLRKLNYGNREAHTFYIQLQSLTVHMPREYWYPDAVQENCHVILTGSDGKTLEYILVKTPKFEKEISLDEPLGKSLLARRINEQITIGDESYFLSSIMLKYARALHDSMDQISARFNNEGPIKVMRFKPGDSPQQMIADLIPDISEHAKVDNTLKELYRSGITTIGVNAERSGISPIKYWQQLVSTPDPGVFSVGNLAEFKLATVSLKDNAPLVLDITCLLALFHTNLMYLLAKISNDKFIANSTIDLVDAEIGEIEQTVGQEGLYVQSIGGQIYRQIITIEEKQKHLARLKEFRSQIKQYSAYKEIGLSTDFQLKTKHDKLLSRSFNESIILANQEGAILYSDDYALRNIAANEMQVRGLSTIGLAGYLRDSGMLEMEEWEIIMENLIKLNYRFVPVTVDLVMKLAIECQFAVKQPFINSLDTINIALRDIHATRFVGDLFFEVYLNVSLKESRDLMIQFILKKLFEGRHVERIKSILVPYLYFKFKLLPVHLEELLELIRVC